MTHHQFNIQHLYVLPTQYFRLLTENFYVFTRFIITVKLMHCKLILPNILQIMCVSFGKMNVTAKCCIGLYKDYKYNILDIF